MIHYQELPFDHLSFLLADDMSYFDTVLDTIQRYNPVPDNIAKKEKHRRVIMREREKIEIKKPLNQTQQMMLIENNKTMKAKMPALTYGEVEAEAKKTIDFLYKLQQEAILKAQNESISYFESLKQLQEQAMKRVQNDTKEIL